MYFKNVVNDYMSFQQRFCNASYVVIKVLKENQNNKNLSIHFSMFVFLLLFKGGVGVRQCHVEIDYSSMPDFIGSCFIKI